MTKKFVFIYFLLYLISSSLHLQAKGYCSSNHSLFANVNSPQADKEIQIEECIEVDSVVADFPVRFSCLASDNMQFVAYYNKNRALTVASRRVTDKKRNYKILPSKVGWDSHNSITMAFDADKCIHISGNMHNDSLIYFKTNKPLDISTFSKVFPQVSLQDELSSTYPNFSKDNKNRLVFSYRKGGSGNGITISNVYNEKTKTFARLTDKPLFDGLNEMSAYYSGPNKGADGQFHMIWVWRDTPGCESNHDLSYARSTDLVHWKTMDGTNVELPITPRNSQFVVDPIPAKGGAINGGSKLFFDANNNPLIAYMKYDAEGNSQFFIAKAVNKKWNITQISDWDYRWNFSGPGSIESEIKLSDVNVENETIKVKYWHVKKRNGELIVDSKSLTLLQDTSVELRVEKQYPDAFTQPMFGIPEMSVQWMRLPQSEKTNNAYYAFRWETLGKRRFYEPTETPIPPVPLKLYKFRKE